MVDRGVLRQACSQVPAEKTAGPGDQDDFRCGTKLIHRASLAAGAESYLPSFLRWTRVRRSSLRCFFFDMRLRRFLITEPMNSATYRCVN